MKTMRRRKWGIVGVALVIGALASPPLKAQTVPCGTSNNTASPQAGNKGDSYLLVCIDGAVGSCLKERSTAVAEQMNALAENFQKGIALLNAVDQREKAMTTEILAEIGALNDEAQILEYLNNAPDAAATDPTPRQTAFDKIVSFSKEQPITQDNSPARIKSIFEKNRDKTFQRLRDIIGDERLLFLFVKKGDAFKGDTLKAAKDRLGKIQKNDIDSYFHKKFSRSPAQIASDPTLQTDIAVAEECVKAVCTQNEFFMGKQIGTDYQIERNQLARLKQAVETVQSLTAAQRKYYAKGVEDIDYKTLGEIIGLSSKGGEIIINMLKKGGDEQ